MRDIITTLLAAVFLALLSKYILIITFDLAEIKVTVEDYYVATVGGGLSLLFFWAAYNFFSRLVSQTLKALSRNKTEIEK
jgi:hypothetical protein